MSSFIQQLHGHIARNEFRAAFKQLESIVQSAEPEYRQLFIELQGRFHHRISLQIQGTLSNEESTLLINQIRSAMLDFIEHIRHLMEAELDFDQGKWAEFKELLRAKVVIQKNINYGNVSHVGTFQIGDTIHQTVHVPAPTIPKELTHHLPRRTQDQLIGRDAELRTLRQQLLTDQQVCVVNGIGGIGKTSLAEAYVHAHYDHYAHIAWVTQESQDLVQSFFTATTLQSNLRVPANITDQKERFAETLNRLRTLDGSPCLLVLDNAEESVSKHLDALPKGPKWHLLLTSRHTIGAISQLELDRLEPDAALALFKSICTDFKDEAAILELLAQVEYHTLTVEILAKTATNEMLSLDELNQALAQDLPVDFTVHRDQKKVARVMGYLTRIFNIQGKLDEAEQTLLKYWTCLPPIFLSLDQLKAVLPEEVHQADRFGGRVNGLVRRGWLQKGEGRSFKIHRVVADVLWAQFAPTVEEMEGLIWQVTKSLFIDDTRDNPVDKFPWLPFGWGVLNRLENSVSQANSTLKNALALVLCETGDFKRAKILQEQVIAINSVIYIPGSPEIAVGYSNLATTLRELGDFSGAKKNYEKALKILKKTFGSKHPRTSLMFSNLALVLQDLGCYHEARKLLEKTIEFDEDNLGTNHTGTARNYANLAMVLRELGDYKKAKTYCKKAIDIFERRLGYENPKTINLYSNMALVLQDLGDYDGAKELLEKAVASDERNFGKHHPKTAVRNSNLAIVLKESGNYTRAKIYLEEAIKTFEKHLGPDHPTTARSYSNLGNLLQEIRDFKGAKNLLEKAVTSDERNFGPTHQNTAISYNNLGSVLRDMEDYENALPLFKKALSILRMIFPEVHPKITAVKRNFQRLLEKMQT